jgi:thioredoxin 1
MAARVGNDDFAKEVLESNVPVLVDFYSDSCIPCKRMSPVLAKIEEKYDGKLKVVKLNINFDAQTAENYEVQSVPTLVFFKDGNEVSRLQGAKKENEIALAIEEII